MTANTSPIYTITPNNGYGQITTAATEMVGTSANAVVIFTAGSNGSFLQSIRIQAISTSGSQTTSACNIRIYINNGSSAGTASNNNLIGEWALPSQTVNTSATVPSYSLEIGFNKQLKASYTILAEATAVASNTQINIQSFGGDY